MPDRGAGWSKYVEDLEVWNRHCSFHQPDPFPADLDSCSSPATRLPEAAFRKLVEEIELEAEEFGRKTNTLHRNPRFPSVVWRKQPEPRRHHLDRLFCVIEQAVFLPEGIEEFLGRTRERWKGSPRYWHSLALVELRHGRLEEALEAWNEGLELVSSGEPLARELTAVVAALGRSPVPHRADEAQALRRFLRSWSKEVLEHLVLERRTDLTQAIAGLELRIDPAGADAERWANLAILLSRGGAEALELRGRLETLRGRPDRALPWWTLAARESGEETAERRRLRRLRAAAVALGWWPRARSSHLLAKPPTGPSLRPGDALPHRLPDSCLPLLKRIARTEIDQLIHHHGPEWQQESTHLVAWQKTCQWTDHRGRADVASIREGSVPSGLRALWAERNEEPAPVAAPLPSYGDAARRAALEGDVRVRVTIDEWGRVVRVKVLESLPMGLTTATVDSIRRWRFYSAIRHGVPVRASIEVLARFRVGAEEESQTGESARGRGLRHVTGFTVVGRPIEETAEAAAVSPRESSPRCWRVFVTRDLYPGDLKRLAPRGVDQLCQQAADAAELGGSWVAWLSGSSSRAERGSFGDGPWCLIDGTEEPRPVFEDAGQLLKLPNAPLDRGPRGSLLSARYWTGGQGVGEASPADCESWTSVEGVATVGSTTSASEWAMAGTEACTSLLPLLCVEVSPARSTSRVR